eukprot:683900-Rhodomonas_salina.1
MVAREYRAWSDFDVLNNLDVPCCIGEYEPGDDAFMLWANSPMLNFFGMTLENFQQIHMYRGNTKVSYDAYTPCGGRY